MNKVILYSTRNYSQYPGINQNEKEYVFIGFPGGSDGKESACNSGDLGSIPGSGRPSGEGNVCSPTAVEFHGQRNLLGYSPWSHKESDRTD